jgi:hypothetical protein
MYVSQNGCGEHGAGHRLNLLQSKTRTSRRREVTRRPGHKVSRKLNKHLELFGQQCSPTLVWFHVANSPTKVVGKWWRDGPDSFRSLETILRREN